MPDPEIRAALDRVDADRLRQDLFHLSSDPLPFRKLNYTVPGHAQSSLDEADDYIARRLDEAGWTTAREPVVVQAFRCDTSKPKAHQYSTPSPDDPSYTAHNLWARRPGMSRPEEIVLLCAHKDSQSWVDSPGAHDNATGTSALIELARALAEESLQRSVCLLFCNEEHTPWTSVAAAEGCRRRDEALMAVLNCDGFGSRTEAQARVDEKSHGIQYTVDEGRWLAELMVRMNEEYGVGLTQYLSKRERPGDDDGSFVNAGYAAAIMNGGGGAGTYPYYHREDDIAEHVDVDSVRRLTQVTLAAVLWLDRS